MPGASSLGSKVIRRLSDEGLTLAVAESLTGGLLLAELIRTPGASAVVWGGVVAYHSALKHSVLGVSEELLAAHGAVHPDVASQMASGVRKALSVAGEPARMGISTTGVAGPEPQDGQAVGTVFLGFAIGDQVTTKRLTLSGTRDEIRSATVRASLAEVLRLLAG